MKTYSYSALSLMLLVSLAVGIIPRSTAQAQGTAFSYQGSLNDTSGPASGLFDICFSLYHSTNSSDDMVVGALTNLATPVAHGLFSVTLDFGAAVFTGPALCLQLAVRTNGAPVFTALSPRQPLLPVPYAISSSNLLGSVAAAQISGPLSATQLTGTLSLLQLPAAVVTNGATAVSLSGTFAGDGSKLLNLNHLTANAPYTYSQSSPALGLWTIADDKNSVPLFSVSQDFGDPCLDGTVATWGYNLIDSMTYNAGRFFGASWNWELQSPGSDVRALVLKGAASQSQSEGAYFILETAAGSATPGPHGLFNNSMYVSRNGLVALGNLTDASDQDTSLPLEPFLAGWVNIFPSGSRWSGGSATLPPLVINSQPLVAAPVPNSLENNGSAWWLTDGSGNRAKILTTTVATPIYAHVNGTNVYFSTQP